ncbi:MAG: MurR/RpiR family transcriptional regulator, partial [Gemmobacter sp.]
MAEPSRQGTAPRPTGATVPDIIGQIHDRYAQLRPAEQAVADFVLADVQAAVYAANSDIAARAGVSAPTVTRFCRAIGCRGVRDFKLQLARSLVVGDIYLEAANTAAAEAPAGAAQPSYVRSILTEARRAIDEVERQLDPEALGRAAEILAAARRIVVIGVGGSSAALAHEAHNRLFRYGLTVTPTGDIYLARMIAASLHEGDAVIAISATGRTREVVEVLALARHYRARTIAITVPGSALAGAAEVALAVRIPEYPDTLTPSASRIGFVTLLDLLAAATGYRIGAPARETLRRIK